MAYFTPKVEKSWPWLYLFNQNIFQLITFFFFNISMVCKQCFLYGAKFSSANSQSLLMKCKKQNLVNFYDLGKPQTNLSNAQWLIQKDNSITLL